MISVEHVAVIQAGAERVWATVRDFGDDSWTGVAITVEGSGVGACRRVAMPTGLPGVDPPPGGGDLSRSAPACRA